MLYLETDPALSGFHVWMKIQLGSAKSEYVSRAAAIFFDSMVGASRQGRGWPPYLELTSKKGGGCSVHGKMFADENFMIKEK